MAIKTPISYYGGKQTMLKYILPLIPEHRIYTEAFAGGAAVFFAKPQAEIEVLNDTNAQLINFYKVLKQNFKELKNEIDATVHSRDYHILANFIYEYPQFFSRIKRAWALWVLSKMSFASKLNGSFGYDKSKNTMAKKINNAKELINDPILARLSLATFENIDGLKVIESRDTENAFHFVDPPYYNSDCGHYGGFTFDNFAALLSKLALLKGKFMLTMYPDKLLNEYIKKHNWKVKKIERTISVSTTNRRKQLELIVMNYKI